MSKKPSPLPLLSRNGVYEREHVTFEIEMVRLLDPRKDEHMAGQIIAHVKQKIDNSWDLPHLLDDHIIGVSKLASNFALIFNSSEIAEIIGIFHDLGKYAPDWQIYLREKSGFEATGKSRGRVEHSIVGAKYLINHSDEIFKSELGKILSKFAAYCIAGHHPGLPDWDGSQSSLDFRLQNTPESNLDFAIPHHISEISAIPFKLNPNNLEISIWIRMLFSCLVDADFLDTELYMEPGKATLRKSKGTDIIDTLNKYFDAWIKQFQASKLDTPVNRIRKNILEQCLTAASDKPGIFSLTVPTGGGKTISSLAFALKHALFQKLRRIIYVIPYTSIIEQNAEVIRNIVGSENVIEHHSNYIEDSDEVALSSKHHKLACENWDAPVIVTTSVQFFESLFSARTSKCRKLHNIANSVVIIDEAQLVPAEYLQPILETMEILSRQYGVTFVISTATQPAFSGKELEKTGFPKAKEIIEDPDELYRKLKRVTYTFPSDSSDVWDDDRLTDELKKHSRVLCIVSDRKSCRNIAKLMPEGTFHLSALMCGEHRSNKIKQIKEALKNGNDVRVISTQLVEAGVDLDFPVVYRSFAGLDSIAQAGGRCNREGKLETGQTIVFHYKKKPPRGLLTKAADATGEILRVSGGNLDSPKIFSEFFDAFYGRANSLDSEGILKLLRQEGLYKLYFRTASDKFKIIDESLQKSVFVPYGEQGSSLINDLRLYGPERFRMRKLQRYSVNIYKKDFFAMKDRGSVEEIYPGIYVLTNNLEYSEHWGLLTEEAPDDPGLFIC